ncbi:MAG: glycosyltransferase [Acetobacteraceae bacterium]|nr:glycosyltransferase [Acetobacteraceae bacterium]
MYLNLNSDDCKDNTPILIVLSHLRWDFVFQRPQHILTRATQNYDVFYIEEPIFEGQSFSFREFERAPGVRIIQPILPPGTSAADSIFHQGDVAESIAARANGRQVVLWYYTPTALTFGHRVDADLIIFDKMDELASFAFAPPELRAQEVSLMDIADVVFTGGASLHAAAAGRHSNIHCFPSSIDTAHFGKARAKRDPDPGDQSHLRHPRLGYFGVIDERIDLRLIAEVAALRPDWQLVMVGPTAKIDPAGLPQAANIHWLGSKDYQQLPAYLAHWDIGWMPFALNDATRFISPTKTPEFLAAGLPLLSTPIHDVVEPYGRLGLVEIISNAQALVEAGDRMLAAERVPARFAARLAAIDSQLATGSWDATWSAMHALIQIPAQVAAPVKTREAALV